MDTNTIIENNYAEAIPLKKRQLRQEILKKREMLSLEEKNRASLLITERILGHQWYYLSDTILGFVSYGSEIDTKMLLREVLKNGKKLYVPKIEGTEMNFYQIFSLEELQKGYKGIPEPAQKTEKYCYHVESISHTLMLMPGVAFDKMRGRLGYGKGFYDRFLADKEELQLRTIGIGFLCQLVEQVPVQESDIRPCQVICT